MAKKITYYSRLSKERKALVSSLLEDSELKIIEVNLKKGVIIEIEEDECFIILDTWEGIDSKKDEEDDEEEDDLDLDENDDIENID
ncbi:MAG: hypothetical protein ACPGSO_02505 [Vicingaceae bacterium]